MSYFILRNGQQYGPYSLGDVRRYVSAGAILLSDLARTEDTNQWLPLAQVMSNGMPPPPSSAPDLYFTDATSQAATTPMCSLPIGPQFATSRPMPPNVNWAVLLLLSVVTFGLFCLIWAFVVAAWVHKVDPQNKASLLLVCVILLDITAFTMPYLGSSDLAIAALIPQFGATMLFLFAIFGMRKSIVEYYRATERVPFQLSGAMTFFFNVIYFQYKFNEVMESRRSAMLVPVHH